MPVVVFVMEAPNSGVSDGAVHAHELAIRPRVPRLGQSVLDVELGADELEGVAEERLVLGQHCRMSSSIQPLPPGSVKCVPLSVSTVWIL